MERYSTKIKESTFQGFTYWIVERGWKNFTQVELKYFEIQENVLFSPVIKSWYCGYVELKSPLSDDIINEIICHGGITYHKDNVIGFDCNHYGDNGINEYTDNGTFIDLNYVENQCKFIIKQLEGN